MSNHPYRHDETILLVDDDPVALATLTKALEKVGYNQLVTCRDERETTAILADRPVAVILLDLIMPYISGEELLVEIRGRHPHIPVIMATSRDDTATVVRCMRKGAYDYITKPFDTELLVAGIERALQFSKLQQENTRFSRSLLQEGPLDPEPFAQIVTHSPMMRSLFKYCEAIAPGAEPVLISGETGTGKELMARAFHAASGRQGAFVAVNVAGVDDHIFSDTLFGHTKGAFTGADKARRGFVSKAAGGTLFLDEIGELSEASQIKLLRVLQEREYLPLGSDQPLATDARIIVATHKDIETLREADRFRADLYYRLRTHHMELPPLHRRREDIEPLLVHFLEQAAEAFGKKRPAYPPELVTLLGSHAFPGNVRELRAMVFDAVGRHDQKVLSTERFRQYIFPASADKPPRAGGGLADLFAPLPQLPTLKEVADLLVDEALRRTSNNQKIAAGLLGITPPALSKRLKQRAQGHS
jgi:DNA-binding NtrC family response regulator